jgi:hypothetical protein
MKQSRKPLLEAERKQQGLIKTIQDLQRQVLDLQKAPR